MSYTANRYPHVRAAVAWTPEVATLAREHNDANVLSLGARRPWLLRPLTGSRRPVDDDNMADVIDLAPASGDLLGAPAHHQQDWLHAVPKTTRPMRDRVSVQWRWTSKRGRPDTAPSFYDARHFSKR